MIQRSGDIHSFQLYYIDIPVIRMEIKGVHPSALDGCRRASNPLYGVMAWFEVMVLDMMMQLAPVSTTSGMLSVLAMKQYGCLLIELSG